MRFKIVAFIVLIMLTLTFGLADATQRLVLCEKYTNTSCGGCYSANILMDELVETYPEYMAVIRYHVSWPSEDDPFYAFNPSENGIRTSYYGITGVPHLQVDGIIEASSYWSVISSRYGVSSPVEIVMDGTFDVASRTGTLNITATATDAITLDGLFLRVVLTESDLYFWAPNGLRYHNQTMRYMYPYSLGTRVYLTNTGDIEEVSLDINCPEESIVLENCELVAFIQSEQTKEVLQAAKISLSSLFPMGVEDDLVELPHSFQLEQNYPNPFNAGTVISYQLTETNRVELSVYNIMGHKIATLVDAEQAAGNYRITWDGSDSYGNSVASGMYFYKLSTGAETQSKQMMLVK